MDEPLVSCIIPVFNGERFLGEALDTVLSQTYRAIEILIVDDGSIDGTAAVVRSYADRVTSGHQLNSGPAAARNAGVKAARGEFISFLDADDLWEPEKIACQVARMQEHPEIDLCFTRFQNFWMPELNDEAARHAGQDGAQPSAAWSICTLLTRRSLFARFGPFDEALRYGENMTWFLHAAALGARIEVLPSVLMRRRLHCDNVTLASLRNKADEFVPILKAWRDYRRNARDP